MTQTTDRTSGPGETSPPKPGPVEAMFAADEASRGLGVELLEHGERPPCSG